MKLAGRIRWQLKSFLDRFTKLPSLKRDLETYDQTESLDDLVPLLCRKLGKGNVVADQIPEELRRFADVLGEHEPKTVLEIGTAKGGTLYLWSRLCAEGATMVSIDMPGMMGSVRPTNRALYRKFGRSRGVTIHTIDADSQVEPTRKRAEELLAGKPVDFLFIDGDHSYEGVQRDFELYAPLVRPGGLVVFHDIAIGAPDNWIRCKEFWETIEGDQYLERFGAYETTSIIGDRSQPVRGIGVVRLPA